MEIKKNQNGTALSLALVGRLDTTTAPDLEQVLADSLSGVTALEFDFTELEYISSAGLRLLLSAQKTMNAAGTMTVKNPNSDVMEVFEITGFSDILTIV